MTIPERPVAGDVVVTAADEGGDQFKISRKTEDGWEVQFAGGKDYALGKACEGARVNGGRVFFHPDVHVDYFEMHDCVAKGTGG